jgi:hypothetical protein
LFLSVLAAGLAHAAEPKVEGVKEPPAVAKEIAAVLQADGYRVLGADGKPLAEIWFRKEVPVTPKREVEGAIYPTLSPGEFLGVMALPAVAKDFRGQTIKPGTYTLRYELLPNDGNHLGVAANRDFALLVRDADDPGPDKTLSLDELVKLSDRAAGTSHPAVFSMVAPANRALPAAYLDANGYVILAAEAPAASGALPVALIVKGVSMSF